MASVARPVIFYVKGRAGQAAATGPHLPPPATLITPELRGQAAKDERGQLSCHPCGHCPTGGGKEMKGTHPVIWGGDGHKWVVGEVTPSRWVESAAEGAVPCGVGLREVCL